MYQLIANGREVRQLSEDIVIVDINNCSRAQIAETIDLVNLCDPKVVGVDVSFVERREDDDALVRSMNSTDRIVGVKMLEKVADAGHAAGEGDIFKVKYQNWFADSAGTAAVYSAANMPVKSEGGTIRRFKYKFRMADGTETPSFAYAVACKAAPDRAAALDARGGDMEYIYYPSTEFKVITPGQLYDRAEELTGKYVLVGVLNDPADLHRTPLDAHMSGTMIQAYVLNTILTGSYLHASPQWVSELVALLITALFVMLSLSITSGIRGMMLRIAQIVALYLLLYAGYWFFIEKNLMADFSRSFLMLAFAFFSVDIWNGIWTLWKMLLRRRTRDDMPEPSPVNA